MQKLVSHFKLLCDTSYVDLLSIEYISIVSADKDSLAVMLFFKSRAVLTLNKSFSSLEDAQRFVSKEILNTNHSSGE